MSHLFNCFKGRRKSWQSWEELAQPIYVVGLLLCPLYLAVTQTYIDIKKQSIWDFSHTCLILKEAGFIKSIYLCFFLILGPHDIKHETGFKLYNQYQSFNLFQKVRKNLVKLGKACTVYFCCMYYAATQTSIGI